MIGGWYPKCVYFIQAVSGGLIKIGATTAQSPETRLAAMQAGCPVRLRILAVIRNPERFQEQLIHRLFADDRRHGEWFEPTPQLLAYIARYATEVFAEPEPQPNGEPEPAWKGA